MRKKADGSSNRLRAFCKFHAILFFYVIAIFFIDPDVNCFLRFVNIARASLPGAGLFCHHIA
jgi:hypothetical protein